MKVVAYLIGVCALDFSQDEAQSKMGVPLRDIFDFIGETYKFSVRPPVPAGQNFVPTPALSFQTGEIELDGKPVNIAQANYLPGFLAVTARNTDIANTIVHLIATAIDDKFGLRIASSIRATYHVSDVVAEFNPGLEKQIAVFGRIKKILEQEIPREGFPFDVKRIAFGASDKALASIGFSVEGIAAQDFLIERRAGDPHSANRYYSRAPTKTADHERLLALIEQAFSV
jgi:hypothetical protein